MNKISKKDKVLLISLGFAAFVYGGYQYYLVPFEEKVAILKDEKEQVEFKISNVDKNKLHTEVTNLNEELKLEIEEIKQIEIKKGITKAQREQLLLYIGEKAKEMNVNLIKFEEREPVRGLHYSTIPYEIKARGSNKDLVIFLNSLYEKYDYFYVDNINLEKVEIHPTLKREVLNKDSLNSVIVNNWDSEYLNLLQLNLPQDEEGEEKEEESKDNQTTIQLDFLMYFISNE